MDGTGVTIRLIRVAAFTAALFALSVTPALAYQESIGATDPASTPPFSCPTCHGLEAESTTVTPAPGVPSTWTLEATATVGTRKGPHGGYTAGTQKCAVCHTTHGSSLTSEKNLNDSGIPAGTWTSTEVLRFEETIAATCFTCHDGTGGGGVYGVIRQRTGFDPAETSATAVAGTAGGTHRVGWTNSNDKVVIPGGNADGSPLETTFTGKGGSMTCTDCHSPHNSNTVAPFAADRVRSTEDTTSAYLTNRLLKRRPTKGTVSVTSYGSEWCQSCHKGHSASNSWDSNTHPVAGGPGNPWNYGNVSKLMDYNNTDDFENGPLGGDNFGYVLLEDENLADGSFKVSQPAPICQQCHEDVRDIGGDTIGFGSSNVVTPGQAFLAPVDGNALGNPRFQTFPHESELDGLVIESGTDLCINCHTFLP